MLDSNYFPTYRDVKKKKPKAKQNICLKNVICVTSTLLEFRCNFEAKFFYESN